VIRASAGCKVDIPHRKADSQRMEATLDYAETHFPQLLRKVMGGEEVTLRNGSGPVVRMVPAGPSRLAVRPRVGQVTSAPVRWDDTAFAALDTKGMEELGLL
jgi:antitoxin (DNA-binding transcriptional repressor) of toxin-antitoxin stability system